MSFLVLDEHDVCFSPTNKNLRFFRQFQQLSVCMEPSRSKFYQVMPPNISKLQKVEILHNGLNNIPV